MSGWSQKLILGWPQACNIEALEATTTMLSPAVVGEGQAITIQTSTPKIEGIKACQLRRVHPISRSLIDMDEHGRMPLDKQVLQ